MIPDKIENNEKTLIIQECGNCGLMWYNEKINTRCPVCGSYEIIVNVEWEEGYA